MESGNFFLDIPENVSEEIFESIFSSGDMRVERIVSVGHASHHNFWYDQNWNEWVLLLSGSASLLFEGEEEPFIMGPGDWIHIPAHRKHQVEWTNPKEKTIWLAIHY